MCFHLNSFFTASVYFQKSSQHSKTTYFFVVLQHFIAKCADGSLRLVISGGKVIRRQSMWHSCHNEHRHNVDFLELYVLSAANWFIRSITEMNKN